MYYLGIEHGTRGIRCALISDSSDPGTYESNSAYFFEMQRSPSDTVKGVTTTSTSDDTRAYPSIIRELERRIVTSDILLGVMTYSMGDGFTEITPIRNLQDRGIRSMGGAGEVTGLGSSIFDELLASGIPILAVPGIHRDTPTLLPSFRRLFSHCSAPDKVCAAYQASLFLASSGRQARDFMLSDVGANTVTLLVMNGMIAGGIDAALGAPGLIQGPIDLEGIRSIDSGSSTANEVFSTAGLFPRRKADDIKRDQKFPEKYQSLIHAVAMEINGLRVFLPEPESIIFTGSAQTIDPGPFRDGMGSMFRGMPIHYLDHQAGALGGACMARDIHHGKKTILGIKVDEGGVN